MAGLPEQVLESASTYVPPVENQLWCRFQPPWKQRSKDCFMELVTQLLCF